ncbi:MAG TPA: hypothetical protein VLA89_18095, partial [Gemmatimonadales bacterium]|nr:hypothetical protein [Gemmatimonadales bacterium]
MSLIEPRIIPPDDLDLIEQWLRARDGRTPEGIEATIFNKDNKAPLKDWVHSTILKARMKMRLFASKQSVPLVRVGLLDGGGFSAESLREPIFAFARDFELRNRARIEQLLERMGPEANRLKGPLVWRTKS